MKLLATLALTALSLDCSQVPTRINDLEKCMADTRRMVGKVDEIFEANICQLNLFFNGYNVTCEMFQKYREQQVNQNKWCKNQLVAVKARRERCNGRLPDNRLSRFSSYHSN